MTVTDLITKILQRYWRITRALTIGAQGCVIDEAGRILLIMHTYRPGWHFPGGGVERGENIQAALIRELSEEAAVVLDAPPQLFAVYSNASFFPGDHIALYVVRQWHQPAPPKPNREIAAHGFFAPDNLPADVNPPTARRIAEITGGGPVAELW